MKSLKIFFIVIAILGYAVLLAYVCIASLTTKDIEPKLSEALIYIANGLCGLIGGIVASAFGVSIPETVRVNKSKYNSKMSVLGSFIRTGTLRNDGNGSKSTEFFGKLYAWVYIIIGVAAIVIWIKDDVPHSLLINIATISFGLILVVVANFFDEK